MPFIFCNHKVIVDSGRLLFRTKLKPFLRTLADRTIYKSVTSQRSGLVSESGRVQAVPALQHPADYVRDYFMKFGRNVEVRNSEVRNSESPSQIGPDWARISSFV